jgi:hypothetical protein
MAHRDRKGTPRLLGRIAAAALLRTAFLNILHVHRSLPVRGRFAISKLLEWLFNSRLAQTGCGLKRTGDTGTEFFPDNGRGFFDVQLLLEDMGH